MNLSEAQIVIEGLIFASERPLSVQELAEIVELDPSAVESIVERIREYYAPGALLIRNVGGRYQVVTKPELSPWIEKLGRPVVHAPLTVASTETLAIIAYQEPVTRPRSRQSVVCVPTVPSIVCWIAS